MFKTIDFAAKYNMYYVGAEPVLRGINVTCFQRTKKLRVIVLLILPLFLFYGCKVLTIKHFTLRHQNNPLGMIKVKEGVIH